MILRFRDLRSTTGFEESIIPIIAISLELQFHSWHVRSRILAESLVFCSKIYGLRRSGSGEFLAVICWINLCLELDDRVASGLEKPLSGDSVYFLTGSI